MTIEHEELKHAVTKLTDATQGLTLQIAALNQYRVADHEMLQDHHRVLNGAGANEPGLIEITRETQRTANNTQASLGKLNDKIEKVAWIVVTPVIVAAVVIFFVVVGNYFSGKMP